MYQDKNLKPGLNYIYAVQSVRKSDSETLVSDFSEISEGWTAKEKNPPGIPGNLRYTVQEGAPLLSWEPVEKAEGYYIFRWDSEKEDFLKLGESKDNKFLDRNFTAVRNEEIQYYIVQAYNAYGSGFATDCLSVVFELEKKKEAIISIDEEDDIIIPEEEQSEFEGEYNRSDYFDYEYTMAQFREYYQKEMEAFRSHQRDEKRAFEEWKKKNSP